MNIIRRVCKAFLAFLAVAIIPLVLMGRGESDERPSGEHPTEETRIEAPEINDLSQDSQAVEGVDLKLMLTSNQKYGMRMTSKENISETSQGQVRKHANEEIMEVVFHVEEVNSQGDILMKVTFGKLKIKRKSPGSTFEFDSTKPDAGPYNPLAPTYSALIGQSLRIKVASNGSILELQSIDDMIRKMAEKVIAADTTVPLEVEQ